MSREKLAHVLRVIASNMKRDQIPYSVIGALALAIYGIPRYTADIDLLCERTDRRKIGVLMARLGYSCFQQADTFSQFDSPLGVYGQIDFMFAGTDDGRDIIDRSITLNDPLLGRLPVGYSTRRFYRA